MNRITANEILNLLGKKHYKDIFVSECKNGSTYFSRDLKKLDAWVMPRSWSKLKFIGYEIKVNRQDFLKDNKYHKYMKLCNEFYIVTSKGICNKDEVPEKAGLLELSNTGNRFFTRKKAMYREIDFPQDLFIYILMCRAKIIKNEYYHEMNNKEYWENWLRDNDYNSKLGRSISKKLQENYKKNVEEVKIENNKLKKQIKDYDEFKKLLLEMNITDKDSYWDTMIKINSLKENLSLDKIERNLVSLQNTIEYTLDAIKIQQNN